MNDNSNPFQMKQDENLGSNEPMAEAGFAPTEQTSAKKPAVALDGVSPQYNDEYSFPMPPNDEAAGTTPLETYPDMNTTVSAAETTMPTDFMSETDYRLDDSMPDTTEVNPLDQPAEITPSLEDPDETAIEINPNKKSKNKSSAPAKFKTWQFMIALALALIGITGTVFFMIEYNKTNSSLTEIHGQLQEYRAQAESGQTAMQQLESLQSTVQEQAEKITSLKEENDSLKKTKDELKSAKEEIEKLKKEKEELVNNYAKILPNSSDRR